MKITKASTNDEILMFDNGKTITFDHGQDCCEWNYADFDQIDDIARNADFDENLIFEKVGESGFRFGDKKNGLFFVPCYSEQNGYYTCELSIYYDDKEVCYFEDLEIIDR